MSTDLDAYGRNFLRCWHGRKDSPLDVIVVNDSGWVSRTGTGVFVGWPWCGETYSSWCQESYHHCLQPKVTISQTYVVGVNEKDYDHESCQNFKWVALSMGTTDNNSILQLRSAQWHRTPMSRHPMFQLFDLVVNVEKKGSYSRRGQWSLQKGGWGTIDLGQRVVDLAHLVATASGQEWRAARKWRPIGRISARQTQLYEECKVYEA
ncbi:hypothetical protein NC651_014612 [Populus alba x Populus x berolinensis]|nr:hypothetical protein NC651_014612 [Populus alba x Populus x berolinensis]